MLYAISRDADRRQVGTRVRPHGANDVIERIRDVTAELLLPDVTL